MQANGTMTTPSSCRHMNMYSGLSTPSFVFCGVLESIVWHDISCSLEGCPFHVDWDEHKYQLQPNKFNSYTNIPNMTIQTTLSVRISHNVDLMQCRILNKEY